MTRVESRIPAWAIVVAIVFALACLLGLLFLLVKEQYTTGCVEVSVQAGSLFHAAQVPVSNSYQVAQIRQQVSQAQSMAAAATALPCVHTRPTSVEQGSSREHRAA